MRITKQQALDTLAEVVAEMGEDYVYTRADGASPIEAGCKYSINGEPSCIAGRVIFKLDPEMFKQFAGYEDDNYESFSFNEATLTIEDLDIEDGAVSVLQAAQSAQDILETYRVALDAARAVV